MHCTPFQFYWLVPCFASYICPCRSGLHCSSVCLDVWFTCIASSPAQGKQLSSLTSERKLFEGARLWHHTSAYPGCGTARPVRSQLHAARPSTWRVALFRTFAPWHLGSAGKSGVITVAHSRVQPVGETHQDGAGRTSAFKLNWPQSFTKLARFAWDNFGTCNAEPQVQQACEQASAQATHLT